MQKTAINSQYIRIGKFKLEEVLPFTLIKTKEIKNDPIEKLKLKKEYLGHTVKMYSSRYRVFKEKGVTCVRCGMKGEFFALEKSKRHNNNKFHFNLYAYDEQGNDVLMTKDHTIPQSKGGASNISNYETMCTRCNEKKGVS